MIKMETQLDREDVCPLVPQKGSNTTEEWMDKDMRRFYMVRIGGKQNAKRN